MTTTATKLSARQAWLSVALGVADGLPHPLRLYVEDDRIELNVTDPHVGQRWADWLDPDDDTHSRVTLSSRDGATRYYTWLAYRGGWCFSVHAAEPVDKPDEAVKARLAAALLSPDEEASL